jgi:hypothetical protein
MSKTFIFSEINSGLMKLEKKVEAGENRKRR